MKIGDTLRQATDTVTAKRVFADPIEKDGVTVIPAARVAAGGGAGTGHDPEGQEGEGGGFGLSGRPAGAYVIRGDEVSWRPAVDPNRLIAVVGLVVAVLILTRPRRIRAKLAGSD